MSTITSENFDGVTPPALPTGWLAGAGYQTETTGFVSSPNGLTNTTQNDNKIAYYDTSDDGNGGDAQVSATFIQPTAGAGGAYGRVYCRMTVASTAISGITAYTSTINFGAGHFNLQKCIAGTFTTLGTNVSVVPITSDKYMLFCRAVGSSIILRCQRASDGKWIDSSGTWQTGQQDAIAATDSGITSTGKAGVDVFRQFIPSWGVYADDFLFESIGGASTRRRCSTTFI